MAKDDFDYIAFKILSYYYAWMKNKLVFDEKVLRELAQGKDVDDDYFNKVLRSLVLEGYLEGLSFTKAWGHEYILLGSLSEGSITHAGVQYLKENSMMKKALNIAETAGGLITKLLPLIFG